MFAPIKKRGKNRHIIDPKKFIPIENHGFINKPGGGIWTSDYEPESEYPDSAGSPWVEWTQENQPDWTPNKAGVYNPSKSPEDVNMYTIDSLEDLKRLTHDYKEENPYRKGNNIDFERLFTPKEQGGGGLELLSLTDKGQNETRFSPGDNLYGWDLPSRVWGDPHLLEYKHDVDLRKLIKRLQKLDESGEYKKADALWKSLLAGNIWWKN